MEIKPLIINEWQKGIGESPLTGFGDMRNVDIYSIPGTIRVNGETNSIATAPTDLVKWIVRDDTNGQYFALGDTGKVYKYTAIGGWAVVAGNTTTNASGNGLAIWKDYVLVARDNLIDAYGPLSGSPSWTSGFATMNSTNDKWHPMLVAQNDVVYIGDGRYISSLQELTNFAPGTGATFTWTANALDLPEQYRVKCLAELGNNLMIGTIVSDTNELSGGITARFADIFPWDKSSDSFDLPIRLNDFGVHQMQNINNLLFVTAGNWGHIYLTNGSSTKLLRKIPKGIHNLTQAQFFNFYPGACMSRDGRYYFGSSRGSANSTTPVGMWSVSLDGKLVYEQSISTGTVTSSNTLSIGALYPIGEDNFWMSFRDNATYGINNTATNGYTGYVAYVMSPLFKVGTKLNKKTYNQIEFDLDIPLSTGQGIKLYYRTATNASWTLLGTFDYSTYGAIQSWNSPCAIVDVENLQIKAELAEAGSTRFGLKEIRLI